MDFLKKDFGQKLLKAIDAAGFTQEDFAEKMGVEPASVSRWVNGRNEPKGKRKSKLFEVLNIDESYFLRQESDMKSPVAYTLTEDQIKDLGRNAGLAAIEAAKPPPVSILDNSPKGKLLKYIESLSDDEAAYIQDKAKGLIEARRSIKDELKPKQKRSKQ